MRILVLAVGRLKERAFTELCQEYLKRIQRHCSVDVQEVKTAAALRKHLCTGDVVVALEVKGQVWTSVELASHVREWVESGTPRLVFMIGGSEGLPRDLSESATIRLSLSSLTLPHRLARVLILEQVYRAFSIWRGEPYARED